MADKDLQVREKRELQTEPEQTRPGRVFTPAVDIFESETEITLLADMPGVTSDSVIIDLHNNELKITGEVEPQGSEQETYNSESMKLEAFIAISAYPIALTRVKLAHP